MSMQATRKGAVPATAPLADPMVAAPRAARG